MDKMIIDVTEKHIENADPNDVRKWAIALALLECSEIKECFVDGETMAVLFEDSPEWVDLNVDPKLWTWQYDAIHQDETVPIKINVDFNSHKMEQILWVIYLLI